jgi:hypothetical protein
MALTRELADARQDRRILANDEHVQAIAAHTRTTTTSSTWAAAATSGRLEALS